MTPAQTAIATACNLKGESIYDIAPKIGCHPSTVYRNLQKPEIKALIEREAAEIINRGLKPARRTLTRLAAIGNTKDADKDMLKLSLDASKHITSMAGLSGTTPSTIINALIQVNEAPQQSQELNGLSAFLQSRWSGKIIEVCDNRTVETNTGVQAPYTATTDHQVIDVNPESDPGTQANVMPERGVE